MAEFQWRGSTSAQRISFEGGTDDGHHVKQLPFSFPWFDRTVEEIIISTNGFVSFTASTAWVESIANWFGRLEPIPQSNPIQLPLAEATKYVQVDQIAVFRTDLNQVNQVQFEATTDNAIVTYLANGFAGFGEHRNNFQLVLYSTGNIEMNYKFTTDTCPYTYNENQQFTCENSLSIGFTDASGTRGSQIVYGWDGAPASRTSIFISRIQTGTKYS